MNRRPRWVADTDVQISTFLWQGTPGRVIELAGASEVQLFTSRPLLDELKASLAKKKLAKYVAATGLKPGDLPMNASVEQSLLSKIRTLSPEQVAAVDDFVEFLTAKARKNASLDRLLAMAPALEAAGVMPMSEEQIDAEIQASRAERRARKVSDKPAAYFPRATLFSKMPASTTTVRHAK